MRDLDGDGILKRADYELITKRYKEMGVSCRGASGENNQSIHEKNL